MGNYALGLGVVKALSMGMEGKFRERLTRASALNPGYEAGGVETAWGRYYDKLPWPKRDRKKAQEHLRRALQIEPERAACPCLPGEVVPRQRPGPRSQTPRGRGRWAPLGRYDPPEERRAKALASGLVLQNLCPPQVRVTVVTAAGACG